MKRTKRKIKSKKAGIAIIIILLLIAITLMILGFQSKKEYEFYDFNDNFGTSKHCQIKNNTLICDVNGYEVPVKQYSRR